MQVDWLENSCMSQVFGFDKADLSSANHPNVVASRDAVQHGMIAAEAFMLGREIRS